METGGTGGSDPGHETWASSWATVKKGDVSPQLVGAGADGHFIHAATPPSGDGFAVSKLDPSGDEVWKSSFSGTDLARAETLFVGADDAIYVAGSFSGSLEVGATTLTSAGMNDAFVVKLGADGAVVWARSAGAAEGRTVVNGIGADAQGNVAVTGQFDGATDWGTGPIAGSGLGDMFVGKLDPAGDTLWMKVYANEDFQGGLDVIIDGDGDVLARGVTEVGLDLGGAIVEDDDTFLVKLDGQDGDLAWSLVGPVAGGAVALGPEGSYLALHLADGGAALSKLDADGEVLFAKTFAAPAVGPHSFVRPSFNADHIAIALGIVGGIDLGGGVVGDSGEHDIAIGIFDHDGGHVASLGFGESYYAAPTSIAIAPSDDVIVGGSWESKIDFGIAEHEGDVETGNTFVLELAAK